MDDVFKLIEQFLCTPNAKGGNQYSALVAKHMLQPLFQALPPNSAIFMQAIAVGAFDDENIGFVGEGFGADKIGA